MRITDEKDFTESDVKEALKRPRDFGYAGDNREMFATWALGPVIETRDSKLLDKSNAAAVKRYLESDDSLDGEWAIVGASHWAVGWVDHLSYRVLDSDGNVTRIARVLKAWFDALSEYPIADSEDYSLRENEATLANIVDAARGLVKDNAPDGWESDAYRWFSDNCERAIENCDGDGGYPTRDEMRDCLSALGLLDSEDDENPLPIE